MGKLTNNLKTQGINDRIDAFSYKGLYNEDKQYLENDIVCWEDTTPKVFKRYTRISETGTACEWVVINNFNEEMINHKYTSNDSVYYELVNDSLKNALTVTNPLIDFLGEYYGGDKTISETTSDNEMQENLKLFLENFVRYNVFNLKTDNTIKVIKNINITNSSSNMEPREENDSIVLKIQYYIFNKTSYEEKSEDITIILDKNSIYLIENHNIFGSTYFISQYNYHFPQNDTNNNIEGWNKSIYIPRITIDKYGHVNNMDKNYLLYTPKRPYFETKYAFLNVSAKKTNGTMANTIIWKDFTDSNYLSILSPIAELFSKYFGTNDAILDVIFTNATSNKEIRVSLSSALFMKSNDWTYITPFLRYKYSEEGIWSDGYHFYGDRSLILSTKPVYGYSYDVLSEDMDVYETLYEVRMRVLKK